ncbi:MAG: hypothetical protein JRH09_09625, partial [Deltaproteobacteria bacterium]|nr:hypothetical protein [Deltaproteobacteria bacterium]
TIICMAILFAYFFAIPLVGMVPASFIGVIVFRWVFGAKKWLLSVVFAIILVIFLFFFFEKMANVDIPRGALFDDWY